MMIKFVWKNFLVFRLSSLLLLSSCYYRTPPESMDLEGVTDFFDQQEVVHLPAENTDLSEKNEDLESHHIFSSPEKPPLPEDIVFADIEPMSPKIANTNVANSTDKIPVNIPENIDPEVLEITLESAINKALTSNRQLANSVETVLKSELTLAYAPAEFRLKINPSGEVGYAGGGDLGSGFSYGAGLDLNQKFSKGTKVSIIPALRRIGEHWRTEIKGSITQPLLRGFGREYSLSSIRAAQFANRSACRALYIAEIQLIIKTVQTVYEIIKQGEAVKLTQESFERVQGFAKAAKMKEKIGMADALDVYRAEIELKQAEDVLTSAQEKYLDAQDTLREIMALPLDQTIVVVAPIEYQDVKIALDDAIEIALNNRIEVEQAKDRLGEINRLSWIAKKNLLPDVNLVMNYSNTGQDQIFARTWSHHRESTWGVGLTSNGDFARTAENLAFDQSLIAIQEAQRGIDQVNDTLTLEVKRAFRTLDRARKRIALQESQIHSAEGELYLAETKFDRGLANNFDIIQAEKSLRNAQVNLLTAVIDYIVGEYQLLSALGTLADKPCIH